MDKILPEIIMVGMSRAGTSFMYHNLQKPPQIFVPARKELCYFAQNFSNKQEWYESFFSEKFKLVKKKDILPLRPLKDSDIALYAKYKRLQFKPHKKPYSYAFLKQLEKKYPELFFSISRSIKELAKVMK